MRERERESSSEREAVWGSSGERESRSETEAAVREHSSVRESKAV